MKIESPQYKGIPDNHKIKIAYRNKFCKEKEIRSPRKGN